MIANQLFKQIKAQRGPILVEISNFDDTFYIQVVKADLITQLSARFGADDETGFIIDSNGFVSKDENARYN